jgi:hypothetical protein
MRVADLTQLYSVVCMSWPQAHGQKPLTLTISRWERGQETMAKKVM